MRRRKSKRTIVSKVVDAHEKVNANALWIAIENFDIDGSPATYSFANRLANENHWRQTYANRVIEEYRRFVFLAMVVDHSVTPSKQVDEAWHLHLLYTDSYWNRFTKDVLPRPLHHLPTKGGKAQASKHSNDYQKTLASYRATFRQDPPSDIWPPATQKPIEHNITPLFLQRRLPQIALLILAFVSIAAGCSPFVGQSSIPTSTILLVFGGIGIVLVGLFFAFSGGGAVDPMPPNVEKDERDQRHGGSSCGGAAGGACSTHSHHSDHDGGHESSESGSDGGDGGGSGCGGGGCSSS